MLTPKINLLSLKQAVKVGPGQPLDIDIDDIFVVAEGGLKLSTTVPDEHNKLESSGYLCRKRPGDIVTKTSTQKDVNRKVRDASVLFCQEKVQPISWTE